MIDEPHMGRTSSVENPGIVPQTDEPRGVELPHEIKIGREQVPAEINGRSITVELFTMTVGQESIYLAPLKTWSQLDLFKWRVQGKLPGTPAGLEITVDHVRMGGETVLTRDPEGCAKLERAFNHWLMVEREALEAGKQKAQLATAQAQAQPPEEEPLHYELELDKAGQPHIRCLEGAETVANVAVTVPGINSLISQNLMRKPENWKIGAMRVWIELDGHVFKFHDENGLSEFKRALNEQYSPKMDPNADRDVLVFANPASSSGFDIQFPASDGLVENRRRHLDAEAMELLSDPQRCRVLRKGIIIKLTPPTFVIKFKTPDGGERSLDPGPENTVVLAGKDGQQKIIDLSQPVSHLGLGAEELTEIFNHPSVNRRARRGGESKDLERLAA